MSTDDAIFRSNPHYELVLLDRLGPAERELIAALDGVDDLYGVLRPTDGSELPLRSATEETALLFLTLREPGPLPAYVRRRLGDDAARNADRLVLDDVLEIQDGATYVSGAAAVQLLRRTGAGPGQGRLAELSAEALRYGQALERLPPQILALRLYLYGRRPVTPAWKGRLPTEDAVSEFLGLKPGGSARAALDDGWNEAPLPGEQHWRVWRPRRRPRARDSHGVDYKLYVSTGCESAPAALRGLGEALEDVRGATGFKVARDVYGLCRPDKLVAYFARLEDLLEGASRLRARLGDCSPHGVPFTAPVTDDGLLSWGIDPPRNGGSRASASVSWRMWVTARLADYLSAGRRDSSVAEPWQFALDRLRLDGVDTETWVPTKAAWDGALAAI